MKKYFIVSLVAAFGLKAEIEFSGFSLTSKESLFSLTDKEAARPSGWLKIGDSFADYTIVDFDPEREVLTVKRAEQSLELPLRRSKVKAAGTAVIDSFVVTLGMDGEITDPVAFKNRLIDFRRKRDKIDFELQPQIDAKRNMSAGTIKLIHETCKELGLTITSLRRLPPILSSISNPAR